MDAIAAIATGLGEPLLVDVVEVRAPRGDEVVVQMKASGMCHTDMSIVEGRYPQHLPAILGHEGAGIVIECGAEVTEAKPGDHVIIMNVPHCGHCRPCLSGVTSYCDDIPGVMSDTTGFTWRGAPLATMGRTASFASHTVVRQDQVAVISDSVPFEVAAIVPCGVVTGMGAVLNDAKVRPGSTVLVLGLGSIGLSAIQAARLAGPSRLIAVDSNSAKEDIARRFGATDFVNPGAGGAALAELILDLLGGQPVDYAFECVGSVDLLASAAALVNPYWGVCLAVGIDSHDKQITLPASTFYTGRTVRGTMIGDGAPREEATRIIGWYQDGTVDLDGLVTHTLPLARINEGFDLMRAGETVRTVIQYD